MNFVLFTAVLALFVACVSAGTRSGFNTTAGGSNCNGNCPGWDCPSCPCGESASYQDIGAWCARYSWNQVSKFI
jgi:hypothetical protein